MLLLLFVLILFADCHTCDLTLSTHHPSLPQQFRISFQNRTHNQMEVCFEFKAEAEGYFVARLDYLPYVCLQANNDIPLTRNGSSYQGHVHIKRLCQSLRRDKSHGNQFYSLVYQIRPAYKLAGLLLHKSIVEVYVPLIVFLLLLAFVTEPLVFRNIDLKQKKA